MTTDNNEIESVGTNIHDDGSAPVQPEEQPLNAQVRSAVHLQPGLTRDIIFPADGNSAGGSGLTFRIQVGGNGVAASQPRHNPESSTQASDANLNQARLTVRRAPAGRHIRIVANGARPPALQNSNVTARMRLPPLEPQPLPANHPNQDQYLLSEEPSDDLQRFKCPICYEFLQDPATCGTCVSRFCYPCIARVAASSQKCPTCRTNLETIHRDNHLREQMSQLALSVTCPNGACNTRLPISQVAAHEAICPFVQMKCRYATFGCLWNGPRQQLSSHEQDCPLMRISGFVEQFRQARADQDHLFAHLQQRVAASNGMLELQASFLRRLHRRPSHIGDTFDFVYSATCTPSQFFFAKDMWRLLHGTKEARGVVCNFLTLLPCIVLFIKIMIRGFRIFLQFERMNDNEDQLREATEMTLLALSISSLGALMVFSFFHDGNSSVEWSHYRVLSWGRRPMLRDESAFLLVSFHFAAIEFDGNGFNAILIWLLTFTAATFFPPFVMAIVAFANSEVHVTPPELGRASAVVQFGLRYGLVSQLIGIMPCIDAVALLHLTRLNLTSMTRLRVMLEDDCFLSEINSQPFVIYVALRLAVKAVEWPDWQREAVDTFAAFALLVALHVLSQKVILLGSMIGTTIGTAGRDDLLPHQAGVRREYNGMGMAVFAAWIATLGAIGLSY